MARQDKVRKLLSITQLSMKKSKMTLTLILKRFRKLLNLVYQFLYVFFVSTNEKTCRTVSTGLFDVKPYIKVFILHKPLAMPFTISLPAIDIVHPESLATDTEDGETYAGLVRGSYMVREIDTRGDTGIVVTERPGMNPAKGWSYYVDKAGRSKIT
jgi:hypothetical protein